MQEKNNFLLRRAVNFSFKSELKGLTPEQKNQETQLHDSLDGQSTEFMTHLKESYQEARSMLDRLKKENDPKGFQELEQIVQHRQNLYEMDK